MKQRFGFKEHFSTLRALSYRGLFVAAAVSLPLSASSQVLEEIVVTAQKREESVQDVGIAISAFSGDQLAELGFTNSRDITAMSPGVTNSGSSAGQNSQYSIRGVTQNDFNDALEGPTAIYLDEGLVIQQNGGTFGLFDIERVEVLKGPQGTLFGRNATGGLVSFVTKKPTDTFEAYADLTYARFNEVNVQAAVSGPLGDRVKARAAVFYNRADEIYDNLYNNGAPASEIRTANDPRLFFSSAAPGAGSPVAGGGQDHWNDDTIAGRASFIFDVNEDLEIYVMGHGSRIEQGEAPYQSVPSIAIYPDAAAFAAAEPIDAVFAGPNETREAIILDGTDPAAVIPFGEPFSNTPGSTRPCPGCDFFGYRDPDGADFDLSKDFAFEDNMFAEVYGANGKITWDLSDRVTMVAVSDYKEFDRNITVDVDSAPVDQLQFNSISELTSFTQELRFEGETDRTRWVTGLYYLYSDADVTNGFILAPSSVAAPLVAATDAANIVNLETNSISVFGQIDYDFNDQLTGIFGIRVVQEMKDYSMFQGLFTNGSDPRTLDTDTLIAPLGEFAGDPDPAPYTDDQDETLWSAKWGLNWTPNDDMLVYGSISRGVKAGSFNATLPLFAQVPSADAIFYDQEVLWAYEIGFKSTLFNGLARFNASAYYYDYQDYQAARFIGVSTTIENADAKMYGVEAELFASPIDGLDFFFGIHASDPEVEDIAVGGISRDRRPAFAPTLQMSGLLRYAWPAFGGMLAAQADASFKSFMFNNLTNFAATKNGARTTGNLRLSYEAPDDRWRVTAFVENVADARNENLGFDLTAACGCSEVSYERPRWYGVNVRYNFGD